MDTRRPAVKQIRLSRWKPLALALPAFGVLALFLVYPLEEIVRISFGREGGLGPLYEDSYYLERAWFTFWQAALSASLTILVAIPLAWVLACHEFPGKRSLESVLLVPFVMPTIVVAVAFTALIGPNGTVNEVLMRLPGIDEPPIRLLNTLGAILLAHVFYNVAFSARIIATGWRSIDSTAEDAGAVLGAGPAGRFFRVTLPMLRNPILAAWSLSFLFCFTSFGVVLILGGPKFGTIETEIYRESLFLFRLPVAAALAIAQIVVTFAAIAVNTRLQRAIEIRGSSRRPCRFTRRSAVGACGVLVVVTLMTLHRLLRS